MSCEVERKRIVKGGERNIQTGKDDYEQRPDATKRVEMGKAY